MPRAFTALLSSPSAPAPLPRTRRPTLDYDAEVYYDAETDASLTGGGSSSGSSSGASPVSVTLTVPTEAGATYWVVANHWVITSSGEAPYCFTCVAGGYYEGSFDVTAIFDGTGSGSVEVGTTLSTRRQR